jgi:hypothetical protein
MENKQEIKLEDIFNDEKRQGVKELIDKHKQGRDKIENDFLKCLSNSKVVYEPKQGTLEPIVYNIGDSIRIINPTENQPKLFTTHKVDNDFGVVYYYQLDGKEESIGFSYIKKEEPKQQTLEEASWKHNPLKKLDGEFLRHAFKEGAKWQAERMYSEEDMNDYANYRLLIKKALNPKEWFELTKKK